MMTLEDIVREARALPIEDRKRLIGIIVDSLTETEASQPRQKRNLGELASLGAESWEGIDPQQYLNQLRDEWDQRP